MKFTNVKQLIIKFMGGGLINFPTRFLRWVKINGDTDDSDDGGSDDGGGGEVMDYKTYCDTVIRNWIEDNRESLDFDPSNVVMPDNYIQIVGDQEDIVYDVDYTKPYYPIFAVYNSDLVINGDKLYVESFLPITNNVLSIINGSQATKTPISDNYVGISQRLG